MLENIHIRNYRGLYDLNVEELHRINVITGDNRAGKTSFLEAVYLLCCFGNPGAAALPAIVRSRDSLALSPEEIWETWWKPMFSDFDLDKSAEVSGHHSKVNDMSLSIRPAQPEAVHDEPKKNAMRGKALEFEFSIESGMPVRNQIRVGDDGQIESTQKNIQSRFPVRLLFSTESANHVEDAMLLGKLKEERKDDLVLEALKIVEPRLAGIEADFASVSGKPLIWCDIGLPRRVPLRAMGEAINRVARLMIAIHSTPDGIVLMDEFENGIYHYVLPRMWEATHRAAKEFNVQVIATTHSYECIQAAEAAIPEDSDWFLHRLESDDNENLCVTCTPDDFKTLKNYGLEVR